MKKIPWNRSSARYFKRRNYLDEKRIEEVKEQSFLDHLEVLALAPYTLSNSNFSVHVVTFFISRNTI